MKTTQAFLYGPLDLRLEEVELPALRDDQVLIRVGACGICQSDIECFEGHSAEGRYDIAPYTPGHEFAGLVEGVGGGVLDIKVGDKVAVECVMACGVCANCKSDLMPSACLNMREVGFRPDSPGGWSERMIIEERFVHRIPEDWSYLEGAYVENFNVGYFGVWGNGGHIDASETALITGAGPIGISAMLVTKASGAFTVVADVLPERRALALKYGADHVLDPLSGDYACELTEITRGGPDVWVECSGNDAATASIFDLAGHSCRVGLVGHTIGHKIPVEIGKSLWKTLEIRGSGGTKLWFPRTIRFMDRLKRVHGFNFEDLVTHQFALGDLHEAVDVAANSKTDALKVMLVDSELTSGAGSGNASN